MVRAEDISAEPRGALDCIANVSTSRWQNAVGALASGQQQQWKVRNDGDGALDSVGLCTGDVHYSTLYTN